MAQPEYGANRYCVDRNVLVWKSTKDIKNDSELERGVSDIFLDMQQLLLHAIQLLVNKNSPYTESDDIVKIPRGTGHSTRIRRRKRKNRAARRKRQARKRKQTQPGQAQEGGWLSRRTKKKMQRRRVLSTPLKGTCLSRRMKRALRKRKQEEKLRRACMGRRGFQNEGNGLRRNQRTVRRFKLPLDGGDKVASARGLRPSCHSLMVSLTSSRSHYIQASVKVIKHASKNAKGWTVKILSARLDKVLAMLKSVIGQRRRVLDDQAKKDGQFTRSKHVEKKSHNSESHSAKMGGHCSDITSDGKTSSEDDSAHAFSESTEQVSCRGIADCEDCKHSDQPSREAVRAASLFARHGTDSINITVDRYEDTDGKKNGTIGCVCSTVDYNGQSPVDSCDALVNSQQESSENNGDTLNSSAENVLTDTVGNDSDVEHVGDCSDKSKSHNCVSGTQEAELATADLPASDEKFGNFNKVRPRFGTPYNLVSSEAVRDVLETLEKEVNQPPQAKASLIADSIKSEDTLEDDEDETSQFFSVDRVSPSSQEFTVAMMRTQRLLSSPHTQRLTTVQNGFNQEIRRLGTFFQSNTPDGIFVIPIAKTGFFLTSSPDDRGSSDAKVECAFCAVIVDILLFLSRIAEEVHREVSPRCPFLLGENVGNVSIAEIAEQAGAKFLDKYPLTAGCTTSASATTRSLQTATSPLRRDHLAEVLATDSEPTAAEEPASYPLSLPTDKPGSVFSSLPADIRSSQPFGNNDSGRLRDTAGPQLHQQLQRDGTQGSGSRDVGETVADSRPALAAGTGGSHLAASASATAPSAGRTEMPYQTATFSTPEPQSSSTGTATPSQTTTANQPASNQTNGPHQTATVSAGPVTSGGTAREAPQSTAPGSEGEDRSQTSGNGGGTDSSGRSENANERQLVTYEELGIFSQRPKRPDMAVTQVRINTFEGWPHQASHPKEEMAEAGFYYTGHADLVRCFHCKGGLKTWESSDQPWIEHSRWFPRCPFIKLCKGQKFVQGVQKLNDPDTRPTITESDVLVEIRRMEDEERSSLRDDVVLLENLRNPNAPADPVDAVLARTGLRVDADVTEASMQEVAERLAEENEELTSSTLCKMCQTNEVNVLFLPCGHLVSCAQCAPALRTCAMCRQPVRGSVRVLLDEKRESEEARQQPPSGAAASTH